MKLVPIVTPAFFEQFSCENVDPALAVLDISLKKKIEKRKQVAARMLGFSCYEAVPLTSEKQAVTAPVTRETNEFHDFLVTCFHEGASNVRFYVNTSGVKVSIHNKKGDRPRHFVIKGQGLPHFLALMARELKTDVFDAGCSFFGLSLKTGEKDVFVHVTVIPSGEPGSVTILFMLEDKSIVTLFKLLGVSMSGELFSACCAPGILFVCSSGQGKTTTFLSLESSISQPPEGESRQGVLPPKVEKVGEVRDLSHINLCIEAVKRGSLVIANITAASVQNAIYRLVGMGADLEQLSPYVIGIISRQQFPVSCQVCNDDGCLVCKGSPPLSAVSEFAQFDAERSLQALHDGVVSPWWKTISERPGEVGYSITW